MKLTEAEIQALGATLKVVARLLKESLLEGDETSWVDQGSSPFGPRRHVAICRARQRRGLPGVGHIGRRWVLSPEALQEELAAGAKPKPHGKAKRDLAPVEALRKDLELIQGGRK